MGFLYRGVHSAHPALEDARRGIVRPAHESGEIDAAAHNRGNSSGRSPFTSWTANRDWALWFARRSGPGGILLRVPQTAPRQGDNWSWEWSPDQWLEGEMLMRGVRLGVEVLEV